MLLAYLVLPRLHRILTTVYVPDYFIGRARTSDGLLGDPVNLAFLGEAEQIHAAMSAAGWTRADDGHARLVAADRDLDAAGGAATTKRRSARCSSSAASRTSPTSRRSTAIRRSATTSGSGSARTGGCCPGGSRVDWLAAGTFDTAVGLSLFTLQVTHRIDADTDIERDHIVKTVTEADRRVAVTILEDFSTGYHARNGGGDSIRTDGDLPDRRRAPGRRWRREHSERRERPEQAPRVRAGLRAAQAGHASTRT